MDRRPMSTVGSSPDWDFHDPCRQCTVEASLPLCFIVHCYDCYHVIPVVVLLVCESAKRTFRILTPTRLACDTSCLCCLAALRLYYAALGCLRGRPFGRQSAASLPPSLPAAGRTWM